jgi:hypothetical protein
MVSVPIMLHQPLINWVDRQSLPGSGGNNYFCRHGTHPTLVSGFMLSYIAQAPMPRMARIAPIMPQLAILLLSDIIISPQIKYGEAATITAGTTRDGSSLLAHRAGTDGTPHLFPGSPEFFIALWSAQLAPVFAPAFVHWMDY